MHLKRLIIAVIVLPLFYLYITKLSAGFFLLLVLVVTATAQYEFYSIYNVRGFLRYSGIVLGIFTIVAFSLQPLVPNLRPSDSFVASFLMIACVRLFWKRNPMSSLNEIATVAIAILYIAGLFGYQLYLRKNGVEWIVFLYGCVWASDSMAYYIGKGFGRRKLYVEVSPNKTIAGAVGSIAGGVIGAVIIKAALLQSLIVSLEKTIIFGIIIGTVTIIGDLVESMFKRDAGVKDSGSILPGHGGVLDKIDGVLFAGPALYWVAITFGLIK